MTKSTLESLTLAAMVLVVAVAAWAEEPRQAKLDPQRDLISLHYDHAPDRDDGQSAAADRTVLETLFDRQWMKRHAVAVSGAYGRNRKHFRPASDAVMDAAFDDVGGWIAAHEQWPSAVAKLAERWKATLEAGGDVWVKEGGQSDITADVVRELREEMPDLETQRRIHVVQHSDWNENQTTRTALDYVKANTDYIRIRDANRYLNRKGGDEAFVEAAKAHPRFGPAWRAALDYYDPKIRLDFSDTGELLHMLGLGELGIDAFGRRFLSVPSESGRR